MENPHSIRPIDNRDTLYPLCCCNTCELIFRDHLEIYPGPSECPTCVKARQAQARMNRKVYGRKGRRW